ncbi:MAG: SAM-dependent methyltransferase [Paraglaciecola sp.]|uniref:methyltransferase n=1 Tax=Paraglaciecola sp. TaxID=1920173 RepID=UPI00273FD54B|nr:methyltransferase [Paraglaciecola sp.]MDP5032464.1 SAM-dependent methyltransferase [Paraglaciecola sp.]MDP5130630.1 SAM-dependent methyltransferase [Paraglaciecola sp.]
MSQHVTMFQQLSEQLLHHQHFWRPVAFYHNTLAWMTEHPDLVKRLYALSHDQIDQLAGCSETLTAFLSDNIPAAPALFALSQLELAPVKTLSDVSPHFYAGIPGRKWQQIKAFTQSMDHTSPSITEWCAGKSHLGFYLQHVHKSKIEALEWDSNLVEQANQRAQQHNVPLHSHCIDVLNPEAEQYLRQSQHVVALHACGELHEHLLQLSIAHNVNALHLAPCCYHKRRGTVYQPLSTLGRSLDLGLNKTELHTAVMETVTAGATVQRQRKQLQIMRLGFDCLQRVLLAKNEFLSVPSLPMSWAKAEFSDFCRHCAHLVNIELPLNIDWNDYLQQGETRFKQVSALDLVRFLFRRPIEVWLALDRALMLEEQGYKVSVTRFCSPAVTPRNILIQATLKANLQPYSI